MPRRGTARADAIRRAHQAKAARDAARQHREALIESALTDYYQAAALAERIRDTARRKADELLTETERTVGTHDAAAAEAVRRLRELLGGITETAQLCGLSATAVRDILASRNSERTSGTGSGPDSGRSVEAGGQQAGSHQLGDTQPTSGGDRRDG
jgi:hypothetical protein